ncbi:hypothetical protein JOF53_003139 [Crossiella equi]|uniref:N-acetyltransferase domain-containing protein n=1 Tax=Crossiella equi TaxID=130796 RepID=A0ABS5AD72_9PSEU|nr:hypothetical protein [Crossiella equi]MBP2474267.1 hypothetical protein [Crossiella equi]
MTTSLDRLLRKGTPADGPTLTRLLADSWLADPLLAWVFPDPVRRARLAPAFFRVHLDLALAAQGVFTTADVDAVLLTLPPGATALNSFQERELARRFTAALGPEAARVRVLDAVRAGAHPQEVPHRYLGFAGVSTDPRRTGGARLLPAVLERCDQLGEPGYLEASGPAAQARAGALGFTVCGPDLELPGGPLLRPMWREPR